MTSVQCYTESDCFVARYSASKRARVHRSVSCTPLHATVHAKKLVPNLNE